VTDHAVDDRPHRLSAGRGDGSARGRSVIYDSVSGCDGDVDSRHVANAEMCVKRCVDLGVCTIAV